MERVQRSPPTRLGTGPSCRLGRGTGSSNPLCSAASPRFPRALPKNRKSRAPFAKFVRFEGTGESQIRASTAAVENCPSRHHLRNHEDDNTRPDCRGYRESRCIKETCVPRTGSFVKACITATNVSPPDSYRFLLNHRCVSARCRRLILFVSETLLYVSTSGDRFAVLIAGRRTYAINSIAIPRSHSNYG